ncbi:MAG: DNA topoisomerase I, partial [Muribaculaceae bacterium]|nr:DNA topoisomerase I [Muribaculaceae bacterium]
RYNTSSKGAQEAHEAIRPTYASNHTIDGTPQEKRLYGLIWKRAIASQMADAEIEKTTVDILPSSRPEHFAASGEVIKFDGFLKVYMEGNDRDDSSEQLEGILPAMAEGETLSLAELTALQRFTQTPPRYTEASLVKKLEELGIGRPSTYAPTISTIQQREYVEKGEKEGAPRDFRVLSLRPDGGIDTRVRTENVGSEKGKLIPTDIGEIVNTYLTEYFPDILDYNFTAQIEEKFDKIAEGQLPWHKEIEEFYEGFHPGVESALNTRLEHKVGERLLGTDPATGKPVTVKIGRFGPMVQLGDSEGEEKPEFASLLKGQSVSTITLEEALKLFAFPRHIGEFEGKEVTVAIGRFGPYVKHDGKFVSIPKDLSPSLIGLDEAARLIEEKRQAEANRLVKTFDEEPDIQILNGRYGVYIAKGKSNYKIPKTVEDPASLSLDECRRIIAEQDAKPKRTTSATRRRKS